MKIRYFPIGCLVVIFFLNLFLTIPVSAEKNGFPDKTGTLMGTVLDIEVKKPLDGAKVNVLDTTFFSLTDKEGHFSIEKMPVGSYILEVSKAGYIEVYKTDVIVKSRRITFIRIELSPGSGLYKEITVSSGYFSSPEEQSVSEVGFSNEEIRRAAGAGGDVSRIISGLPSIAQSNDMVNGLVVRGGSPCENSFYIDNIEVPNINHYPQMASSTGAIGLLNVDFIRDVRFYAGGFSPVYGDSLSSVMDISFREGNSKEFDFQFDLSMMGLGIIAEGPLGRNNGSFLFSARRSYIDLLIRFMGSGVPVTWSDFQVKVVCSPSRNSRLTILGLGGIDDSGSQKEDAVKDGESHYGGLDTTEYTVGMNWFQMWGDRGYSNTSLSRSYSKALGDAFDTLTGEQAWENSGRESVYCLRNVNHFNLSKSQRLQFGGEAKFLSGDYESFQGGYIDPWGVENPSMVSEGKITSAKYGLYANHSWNLFSGWTLNSGFRADYFEFNKSLTLSPRFSLSVRLDRDTVLTGSAGLFSQSLPMVLLYQKNVFKDLQNPTAVHIVLGLSRMLSQNTRLTIEVYDKEYSRLPMNPDSPLIFIFDELVDRGYVTDNDTLASTGKARAYGIEFLLQKRLADKLYGLVSASCFRTCYRDGNGVWRDRKANNRFLLTIEGGYKFNRNWECGLKWHFAGGAPYTPFDLNLSRDLNSGILDTDRINSERLRDYHSLNIRLDRRFYFQHSNLTIYISVWNLYNRSNVASSRWNTIKNEPGFVPQWNVLPCLGVEYEF
ncbi:MAG: TonB-dependent receptor [Candidatus Aminicenantes bacterium]|nr:TonB-dependent receptor [Candidatus Aminicenantes bacterium]